MNSLISFLAAASLTAAPLAASASSELAGPLEPRLGLEPRQMVLRMKTLTAEERAALPAPPSAEDQAFGGPLPAPLATPVRVVLVEPKGAAPYFYVDRNADGKLAAEERFSLAVGGDENQGTPVSLPTRLAFFPYFPTEFSLPTKEELDQMPPPMRGGADRVLFVALFAHVAGRVPVDGKPLLVHFGVTPEVERLDPRNGEIGMDLNGDGEIDILPGSDENERAKGSAAIFRFGDRYLSLKSIDLAAGKMVLEEHPPSDYKRFDLSVGSTVPDFSFVDLDGKPHKLSDWRGRYVLLDFWATWCLPCIAEFPALEKAYGEYRGRGFDVVAVVFQDEDEKVRKFLAQPGKALPWIQATAESTGEIARERFRIQGVPATILLDPEGKVVSAGRSGEPVLRGEELGKTLGKLLPAETGKPANEP